jgi:hypothetical protein
MTAEDRELPLHVGRIAEHVAGVGRTGDHAQGELFPAAGNHDRRVRILHRLRLQDRVVGMEISAMKGCPLVRPHREDELDGFLQLPDANRRSFWKFPAILPVFGIEPTGADTEREAAAADQVNADCNLGEIGRVAVGHGRGERGKTDAGGCRG